MKRILALVVCCLVATPAYAQGIDFFRALKADGRQIVETDLGDGLYSLTAQLAPGELPEARVGKSLLAYIAYTTIGKPSITSGIECFDVLPLEFAGYWYSLIVVNTSSGTASGTATFTLRGPVKWVKRFNNITVGGRTITALFFKGNALNRTGAYLLKAKFSNSGIMKSRFCAGC